MDTWKFQSESRSLNAKCTHKNSCITVAMAVAALPSAAAADRRRSCETRVWSASGPYGSVTMSNVATMASCMIRPTSLQPRVLAKQKSVRYIADGCSPRQIRLYAGPDSSDDFPSKQHKKFHDRRLVGRSRLAAHTHSTTNTRHNTIPLPLPLPPTLILTLTTASALA